MDQLKTFVASASKYGFWIGSALVLLLSIGIWYMSTGTLVEATDSATGKLNGKVLQINSVSAELDKTPNESSHAEMRNMVAARQREVLASWRTLFNRQKPHLTWPSDPRYERLVNRYKDWIPIEQYVGFPPEDENRIPDPWRQVYRDHIGDEPEKIAAIANAEWTVNFDKSRKDSKRTQLDGGDDDLGGIEDVPVVAWAESSQSNMLDNLFPWRGEGTPTTLEIYYSQENLWILRQLMEIIKQVNGDATQPYQAKIREIKDINIGREVRFGAGNVTGSQGTGLSASGGGISAGVENNSAGLRQGMGAAPSATGQRQGNTTDPAEERYVDKNLNHIKASALRSALRSNEPSDASLAVAKRVPVMMSLMMDQRAVHELLASCGSADLMVEVTQVRLLGEGGKKSGGSSSTSLTSGGNNRLSSSLAGGPATSTSDDAAEYPFDLNVEIYGMIYIYNEPDLNKLPVEQITKETVDEALGETPAVEAPESTETPETPADPLEQSTEELPAAATPAGDAEEAVGGGEATPDGADAAADDRAAPGTPPPVAESP